MKHHKVALFACIGGSFNRCLFILEMWGDDLDPDRVSSLLHRTPTTAYRKDDERPRGSQYYRTGGWILNSGEIALAEDDDGHARLESWLMGLPNDAAVWDELRRLYAPRIRLVICTDRMNAEFSVTPKASSELSMRGLPLVVDPYLELDEDEA